ncbi:MAG: GGDEF domain-containing protein [Butyrivibrio sp.]|nr:GGDEF domain-containing protein [Butyrivibrio sp.]
MDKLNILEKSKFIIKEYYKNNVSCFLNEQTDDSYWFGPGNGQILHGKVAIAEYWNYKSELKFTMNEPDIVYIDTGPDSCEVIMTFEVIVHYPSHKDVPVFQRIQYSWKNMKVADSEGNEKTVPKIITTNFSNLLKPDVFDNSDPSSVDEFSEIGTKDALTGLNNREYAKALINNDICKGNKGALFIMDLDDFKNVNDTYGHIKGDDVLKSFAEVLKKGFRENDIICRLGGDEFIVFAKGMTNKKELAKRSNEIISTVFESIKKCGVNTNTSVSIGIYISSDSMNSFDELYNCADKALYISKNSGKNTFTFYNK